MSDREFGIKTIHSSTFSQIYMRFLPIFGAYYDKLCTVILNFHPSLFLEHSYLTTPQKKIRVAFTVRPSSLAVVCLAVVRNLSRLAAVKSN
jgi:hypothetical protein